jgi:hypothetical protein
VRGERSARRCVLELGQPVAHLRAHGEVVLLLVALERLGERGDGFVALAGLPSIGAGDFDVDVV